jgi:organic hydroperoxide reductase OsmC/OhrA
MGKRFFAAKNEDVFKAVSLIRYLHIMRKNHIYNLNTRWTGNTGRGTLNYRSYERNHIISAENKPEIFASSDPAFLGDNTKYNPEELLVASLSGCHMLWFLHLCAEAGVVVTGYTDNPTGIMTETENGGGKFQEVILRPEVTVQNPHSGELLEALHNKAHKLCFISNSVNFPVKLIPAKK